MTLYKVLDIFFLVFHTLIILLNLFGWMWGKTRKLNFILLLLTGASWFILGLFYGIGYCPFTDWHFDVLNHLEIDPGTNSYVGYLIARITGIELNPQLVDRMTAILYFLALAVSLYVNFRKRTD